MSQNEQNLFMNNHTHSNNTEDDVATNALDTRNEGLSSTDSAPLTANSAHQEVNSPVTTASTSNENSDATSATSTSSNANANFECNICFEAAREDAVISMCGHLFCWPCLHRWMEATRAQGPLCPVCKAGINRDRVIPVYGRGASASDRKDPRDKCPPRPEQQRPQPDAQPGSGFGAGIRGFFQNFQHQFQQQQQQQSDTNGDYATTAGGPAGGVHMSFGISAFPFGLFSASFNLAGAGGGVGGGASPGNDTINRTAADSARIQQLTDAEILSKAFLFVALICFVWLFFS